MQQPDSSVLIRPDTTALSYRIQNSASIYGRIIVALVGAGVIIFAGYILGKYLEGLIERSLRRIQLNRILQRAGIIEAVERSGTHVNPPRVIGKFVFWVVMLSVILLAANALGLTDLAKLVGQLVSYIPAVIAAVVILLVGSVLGGFVEGLILASVGGIHGGRSLARLGRAGVVSLSVFMALQELGVANAVVTTAFAIFFGAIALALALSFGLGNTQLAGEVTREWYARFRIERAEEKAREEREEAERLTAETPVASPGSVPPMGGMPPV